MSNAEGKRVFLIDGSAMFYRAYFAFARNPLINSKGENTSASFGLVNSLLKIIREESPDYLAIVFDTKEPTFRHAKYPEYKSTRAKMPDELVDQLPRIQQVVSALNIPSFELEGYEADDVIGTFAVKAARLGCEVWCVTGDKDFFQLVNDQIRVYTPGKASEAPQKLGREEVKEKFGVYPERVIDKLALMGDHSDNVPGIPGIGAKTADKLLEQFGSFDGVLEGAEQIASANVRQKVVSNRESALLSRDLVTIHTETPLPFELEALRRRPPDPERVRKLFVELEFTSLLKHILPEAVPATAEGGGVKSGASYHAVASLADLKKLVATLGKAEMIAVDTETTSLDPLEAKLVGVSLTDRAGTAYYVPVGHSFDFERNLSLKESLSVLKDLLENKRVGKAGQNVKYDLQVLRQHGIEIDSISFDTMLASYVLNPSGRQHSLGALALQHFNYEMQPITDLIGSGKGQKTFDVVSVDKATAYSGADADYTFRLHSVLAPEIDRLELSRLYYDIELPLISVLANMEKAGIRVDDKFLGELSIQMDEQLETVKRKIFQIAGGQFNINSTQQLGHILFEKLGLPTKGKTAKKTGFSTDVSVLEELSKLHEFPRLVLEYRQTTKLKNTYVDAIPALISPRTGRVHTSFNQTIAATGRLSSTNPNLQNIPVRTEEGREIRKAFVPRDDDHILLAADYSQIELRILAHYTNDPGLIKAFNNAEDIHTRTASEVYGVAMDAVTPEMRRVAKTANFAIIYGVSAYGLSQQTDMSMDESRQFIDTYFARYPGIRKYIDTTIAFAREHGYVTTLFNRRRYLPEINEKNNAVRQFAERTAINTPIQGTAADIIKVAMITIDRRLKTMRSKMVLQVHDELVFDVYKEELEEVTSLVKTDMETAAKLKVPMVADIGVGRNWLEAK
ncbi:MAG: DNA polymerase I [candidate division Zixibacteria bacterium]|nr:DNA polymerase I [candidate division Zixibacteria bacterium]